ncbi:PHP domain-containing protein [Kribbella solani]|uniref:Putative hydrolase n=1 Tax=Kribbella solani TaxID=236067 RepID=A0A841DRH1_9ACTN|nr:PHP domain-containing protein [Kribbella solani]MBB5979376.1 putative hydrolase [Kribbella solani]
MTDKAGVERAVGALRAIGYYLERDRQPTHRVKAYRRAADTIAALPASEVRARRRAGTLTELAGIGPKTEAVIVEAMDGATPAYLVKLEEAAGELTSAGKRMRAALQADLHLHSEWSDGGSPIEEMARTAYRLGHKYLALTDHSPRLTVANGLSRERRLQQLEVVAELNKKLQAELDGFTILNGIEVDINEDGTLDCDTEILARLDVVVASVHSKLRMAAEPMTERMVRAIANPHVDVLGHCTGRLITGARGTRPESEFDAEVVFEACRQFGTAVEINSRPERLDPPKRLLSLAVEMDCVFSIDTDAHAPGQLDWQVYGCERAEDCGVTPERVINTWDQQELLEWTAP